MKLESCIENMQINAKIEKSELARKLEKDLNLDWSLKQEYPFDAGFDVRACIEETVYIPNQSRKLIGTGLYIQLDDPMWEIEVRPRSGLAHKNGITVLNSPGTIDFAYRNEIKVILYNTSTMGLGFQVNPGDRIAQICFRKIPMVTFEYVDAIERAITVSKDNTWVQELKNQEKTEASKEINHLELNDSDVKQIILERGGFGSSGVQ